MGRFIESTSLSSHSAIKGEKCRQELHIVLQVIIDLQDNSVVKDREGGISPSDNLRG